MSKNATLALVQDEREVSTSHQTFNRELPQWKSLAMDMVRRTRYWVYDPAARTFSPSKFSGYAPMDFNRYEKARAGQSEGVKFDGGLTQRAIRGVLGSYEPDTKLSDELEEWVNSFFGAGALDGIDTRKWRFVQLPKVGRAGLAELVGGWEGSEELVEAVQALRRTPGRSLPEME